MTSESRKLTDQILSFTGKRVSIETTEGRVYSGTLTSIDENLNVILENTDNNISKMLINGSFVKEVRLVKPFDLNAFVEKLNEIFPGLVKKVGNTIVIMDKIKVTERGVQGSGLAADRVRSLYDEFVKESK